MAFIVPKAHVTGLSLIMRGDEFYLALGSIISIPMECERLFSVMTGGKTLMDA